MVRPTPGTSTAISRRSYRLDRMRNARVRRKSFTPREGFDPSELHTATSARIWYSPAVARWEVEKGARPLVDGAALADKSVGSPEWLVGEVVSYRGEAIVLEPADLRRRSRSARARSPPSFARSARPRPRTASCRASRVRRCGRSPSAHARPRHAARAPRRAPARRHCRARRARCAGGSSGRFGGRTDDRSR